MRSSFLLSHYLSLSLPSINFIALFPSFFFSSPSPCVKPAVRCHLDHLPLLADATRAHHLKPSDQHHAALPVGFLLGSSCLLGLLYSTIFRTSSPYDAVRVCRRQDIFSPQPSPFSLPTHRVTCASLLPNQCMDVIAWSC